MSRAGSSAEHEGRSAPPPVGVVLAGAAALGAYEVGVLAHLVDAVAPEVGRPVADVLAGTSAGAINATVLATFADEPRHGVQLLIRSWTELSLSQILRPSSVELLAMALDLTGAPAALRRALQVRCARGGLLDSRQIRRLVEQAPIARISEHLAAGRLHAVTLSATRVTDGTPVVFYEAARPTPPWQSEANVAPVPTTMTVDHVLASSAIPLLFPPVAIEGEAYCDGGLRQMVPLSPALHLGAERLVVVNPLPSVRPRPATMMAVTSPLYLAGKALNALFADRVSADLARLAHITSILRAGERRYGASFEQEINAELGSTGSGSSLRAVDSICIEPSEDLGALAADHVASASFASRDQGIAARLVARIAGGDPARMGDLLAYLLFDGRFTAKLVELGRADARARHAELCAMYAPRGSRGSLESAS